MANICMNQNCTNELTGRQRTYCGDKCRKAQERADKAVEDAAGTPKSDRLGINVPLKSDNVQVGAKPDRPANYGKSNCECKHCQNNRHSGDKHIINHGAYKKAEQLKANEVNRISWPGDVDYVKTDEPTDLPDGVGYWPQDGKGWKVATMTKSSQPASGDKDMKQARTDKPESVVQSIWGSRKEQEQTVGIAGQSVDERQDKGTKLYYE